MIPLSLYIHVPWCIQKCPYCDFSSIAEKNIPEEKYLQALLLDLEENLPKVQSRPLVSIFIGGGTPSLLSPKTIETLIEEIHKQVALEKNIEITMESNPGTFEQNCFADFHLAGVNRLSIGIQSFQDEKLKALGRIHCANEAKKAVEIAHLAGFKNINLDLMFGLPNQTVDDAVFDLQTAADFNPTHLSWYQLTIEKNTPFARRPPVLPNEEVIEIIQEAGFDLLESLEFHRYEISGFCRKSFACRHNLNYWEFGDYLGLGAGAHGKITDLQTQEIRRYWNANNPEVYLNAFQAGTGTACRAPTGPEPSLMKARHAVPVQKELPLEFMMNALRLIDGVPISLFEERTGLPKKTIAPLLKKAMDQGFLEDSSALLKTTPLGQKFLNDCLEIFVADQA